MNGVTAVNLRASSDLFGTPLFVDRGFLPSACGLGARVLAGIVGVAVLQALLRTLSGYRQLTEGRIARTLVVPCQ